MAECKYKHILDVTRIIMLQMKVLKFLWYYAILTASYLVNRMSSTPLGDEILLRRLHPGTEIFSLPSKVFGCVVFV